MIERLGPVDDFTGLPLPLLPVEAPIADIPNQKLLQEACREDRHHAFFPNASLTTESERVLRHSRLQYGVRWAHGKYHEFYSGVPIPEDIGRQFALGVLATAGYIPETAVDVRGNRPTITRLQPEVRRRMQEETIYAEQRVSHMTGRDMNRINRGMFFMNYALSQDLSHVRQVLLEEFIETENRNRRLKLGLFIVDMAFLRATENIESVYKLAHHEGLIHPARPNKPAGFLRSVVSGYQEDYFRTLASRIKEPIAA